MPAATHMTTTPALPARSIDVARELASEGVREATIRRALGLTPAQWKAAREDTADGDLSPLSLALAEGQAAGADQIIAFMKNKMVTENSERAAEWLADKVFGLAKPNDGADSAPRVNIILNHALAPAEYARVIQVQHGALTHDFG